MAAALWPRFSAGRCAEVVSLALLIAIAGVVSAQGLLPALDGAPVNVEAALALLLMAPALYGTYLVLNRSGGTTRDASVSERLAAALGGPPLILSLALAVAVATCAVLLIRYVGLVHESWQGLAAKFVERGIIPPLTLVLFFWGLLLLANKYWLLWRERWLFGQAARRHESALQHAHAQQLAASEVGDMDDFMQMVWRKSADFYVVPRYINWAIPILGFIGTVLGISLAADGIQNIIGSRGGLADLSTELGQAIAPLGIAFDTTLIALSLSVFLMLLQTALQRWRTTFWRTTRATCARPPHARRAKAMDAAAPLDRHVPASRRGKKRPALGRGTEGDTNGAPMVEIFGGIFGPAAGVVSDHESALAGGAGRAAGSGVGRRALSGRVGSQRIRLRGAGLSFRAAHRGDRRGHRHRGHLRAAKPVRGLCPPDLPRRPAAAHLRHLGTWRRDDGQGAQLPDARVAEPDDRHRLDHRQQ